MSTDQLLAELAGVVSDVAEIAGAGHLLASASIVCLTLAFCLGIYTVNSACTRVLRYLERRDAINRRADMVRVAHMAQTDVAFEVLEMECRWAEGDPEIRKLFEEGKSEIKHTRQTTKTYKVVREEAEEDGSLSPEDLEAAILAASKGEKLQ